MGTSSAQPAPEDRPLISGRRASDLAGLFKVFANETRLRMLHALVRAGELRVTDLAEVLGMKPQAVSNQLQRLADQGIVGADREGSSVLYRVTDPCVPWLLDQGFGLLDGALRRAGRRKTSRRRSER